MVSVFNSPYTSSNQTIVMQSSQKATKSSSAVYNNVNDPIAKFLAYQNMTPEQKLRDAVLKRLGLTEEKLASLPPDELKEAEEKIKEETKKIMEGKLAEKGIFVDTLA